MTTLTSSVSRMRYVRLDVYAEAVTAAVAVAGGTVHELGKIANEPAALRKLLRELEALRVCYEAGRRVTCIGTLCRSACRPRSSRRV